MSNFNADVRKAIIDDKANINYGPAHPNYRKDKDNYIDELATSDEIKIGLEKFDKNKPKEPRLTNTIVVNAIQILANIFNPFLKLMFGFLIFNIILSYHIIYANATPIISITVMPNKKFLVRNILS